MNKLISDARFRVLVLKSINITKIHDVVLCSLADISQHFRGFYYLSLEGTLNMQAVDSSKLLVHLHLTRRCHAADDKDNDGNNNTDYYGIQILFFLITNERQYGSSQLYLANFVSGQERTNVNPCTYTVSSLEIECWVRLCFIKMRHFPNDIA